MAVNTSTGAIPFTVGDAETAATSLIVTGVSSDAELVPDANIVLGGSGANRSVTVTPLAGRIGGATITLTVSDGVRTTNRAFTVTVTGTAVENWRFANFGTASNTGDAADSADPDGDGQSNGNEYAAGTDPKLATDVFRVSSALRSGSTFSASAPGKVGRTYSLERRDDFNAGPWVRVATVGPLAADGAVTLTDPAAAASRGFFRVVVEFSPP